MMLFVACCIIVCNHHSLFEYIYTQCVWRIQFFVYGLVPVFVLHLTYFWDTTNILFPISLHCERSSCKMVDTFLFWVSHSVRFGNPRRAEQLSYIVPILISTKPEVCQLGRWKSLATRSMDATMQNFGIMSYPGSQAFLASCTTEHIYDI